MTEVVADGEKPLPHYDVEITPISSQPTIDYEKLKTVTIDALTKFQADCSGTLPDQFTKYLDALMGEIDSTHTHTADEDTDVEKTKITDTTVHTEQNPKTVTLDIEVGGKSIPKMFKIIETGGGGDCLFHTLLHILHILKVTENAEKLTAETLRSIIVDKVVEIHNSKPSPSESSTSSEPLNLVDDIRNILDFDKSNSGITNQTSDNEKQRQKVNGGVKISNTDILFADRVVTVKDQNYVSEDINRTYQTVMKTQGTYGTEVEIIGAVLLYKISICVYNTSTNTNQCQYFIYKDDNTVTGLDSGTLPDDIQFIYNTGNNHYQYLEEVKEK